MPEVNALVAQIMPTIVSEVETLGSGVLAHVQETAVDATVNVGQRVLAWLWSHALRRGELESAVSNVAADSKDPDAVAALRYQVRRILETHPELLTELVGLLSSVPPVAASGTRSVAIGGANTAPVTTGDRSPITIDSRPRTVAADQPQIGDEP